MIGRRSNRHRGLPALGTPAPLRGDLLLLAIAASLSVHLSLLALNPDRMTMGGGEHAPQSAVAIRFASTPAALPDITQPETPRPMPPTVNPHMPVPVTLRPAAPAPAVPDSVPEVTNLDSVPDVLELDSVPDGPELDSVPDVPDVSDKPAPPRPQAKPREPVRNLAQVSPPEALAPAERLMEGASDPVAIPVPSGPAVPQRADITPAAVPVASDPVLITDPTFRAPPEPPRYPPVSRKREEEGVVVLRAAVSPGGQTLSVQVWQSSGFYRLDDAALDAARRWQFEPAQHAGFPVESLVEVPVHFHLN